MFTSDRLEEDLVPSRRDSFGRCKLDRFSFPDRTFEDAAVAAAITCLLAVLSLMGAAGGEGTNMIKQKKSMPARLPKKDTTHDFAMSFRPHRPCRYATGRN